MATLVTKKRVGYAIVVLVAILAIVSFVLPYAGIHHAGLTPVP